MSNASSHLTKFSQLLQEAAANGDTLLPLGETLERVKKRFPERRACRPDRALVIVVIGCLAVRSARNPPGSWKLAAARDFYWLPNMAQIG